MTINVKANETCLKFGSYKMINEHNLNAIMFVGRHEFLITNIQFKLQLERLTKRFLNKIINMLKKVFQVLCKYLLLINY